MEVWIGARPGTYLEVSRRGCGIPESNLLWTGTVRGKASALTSWPSARGAHMEAQDGRQERPLETGLG